MIPRHPPSVFLLCVWLTDFSLTNGTASLLSSPMASRCDTNANANATDGSGSCINKLYSVASLVPSSLASRTVGMLASSMRPSELPIDFLPQLQACRHQARHSLQGAPREALYDSALPDRLSRHVADFLTDEDLAGKPFFAGLIECMYTLVFPSLFPRLTRLTDMLSGPICAMVWEGRDAVKTGRSMFPLSL